MARLNPHQETPTILTNPIDEFEDNPVQQFKHPPEGRRAVKSLEELGITPIRTDSPNTQNNNNNNRVKSLDELGITPINMEPPAQVRAVDGKSASTSKAKVFKVKFPDNKIYDVPEQDLEKAKGFGGEIQQEELSYGDRALQFGRGVATIPAFGADLVNNYVAAPALNVAGGVAELAGKGAGLVSSSAEEFLNDASQKAYGARDFYNKSNLTGNVSDSFNQLAGKDITPKDTKGKILNAAGEFSFPVSNVVKGAKTTGQLLGAVGKHLGISGAGATALEGTKDYRLTNEGTTGRIVEDFLATLSGMALGDKGLSAAKQKIINNTENILERLLNKSDSSATKVAISKEANVAQKGAAKVLALGANPNLEVNAAAQAEGITLPFEVALGGKFQKFLSNTALKSLFVTKGYNNIIEHADRDMINAVKRKIDEINPSLLDGELSSINAAEYLKAEKSTIKNEVNQLYDKSSSLLKTTDAVKPTHTYEAMNDILPKISPASPSKDMQFVATRISRIGKEWGFLPDLSKFEGSPELIKKIKESWGKSIKEVPASEIDSQLMALKNDLRYEKEIPGVKNLLNGFVSALEKDLGNVSNKEFLEARSAANKYFKENEVDRIRTTIAQSLLKGEVPAQAFTYMQTAPEIRQLQKIMGNSEASNEIITSLKRAKLEQILMSNILDSSGTITYSKLSNMFNKSPEKQALLKELLGDQYAGMKKLATISQGFVSAGKEFGNASRTTLSARDLNGFKDLIKVMGNTAATLVGSKALHGVGVGMAIEPLGIRALSWAASNKKIVNTAIKYAEAAQKSRLKDKEILGKRLTNMLGKFLKHQWDDMGKYPQASLVLSKDFRDGMANDQGSSKRENQ